MSPTWSRRDTLGAAAIALVALATRWSLRGESLYSFDSGLLASGILDFDFASESPHPPYYALTIAAGKALVAIAGVRPVEALVLLSVLASGALAVTTYAVGKRVGGRLVGAGAAAIVVLSPTALFNGAVALSYALEGAMSAAVALAAWQVRVKGNQSAGIVLGIALAIAVGLRPSAALFLAPLGLWAVWGHRRALAGAFAAGLAATLAWFIPMLAAGGGLHDFLTYNGYQTRHVILSRTAAHDVAVVGENLGRLGSYVPVELPFLAAVAVVTVVSFLLLRSQVHVDLAAFLAAWALPGLLFYTFIYSGWPAYPSGYVMVLLPAFAVACALALRAAGRAVQASGAPGTARAIALTLLVGVAAMPGAWAADWDDAMARQREADQRDADWRDVAQTFPPGEAAMVTFLQWHWARIEHPDYLVWGVRPYWNDTGHLLVQVAQGQHRQVDRPAAADFLDGPFEDPHPIPAGVRIVLLPEDGDRDLLKPSINVTRVMLPSGRTVLAFDPLGLSTIEQAMRWFDDDGRLDLSTLPPGDRRGL